MKVEMGKQYRTRDGREVRIYATDGGPNGYRVHGAWKDDYGYWIMQSWTGNGRISSTVNTLNDLIEVKPRIKREVWVNLYRHDNGDEFAEVSYSEQLARARIGTASIACVKLPIDVEEGEGL